MSEEQHINENKEASAPVLVNETTTQGEAGLPKQPNTESETATMEVHHHSHSHHEKKWKIICLRFLCYFCQ